MNTTNMPRTPGTEYGESPITGSFREFYRQNDPRSGGRGKEEQLPYFGYLCTYVPVEILTAAGFVPFRLTGYTGTVSGANAFVPPNCCFYMRSNLEQALNGELDFLKGVIIPQTCDIMREMYNIWLERTHFPHLHQLKVPLRLDTPLARQFFQTELELMLAALEKATGEKVSLRGLQAAILLHNRQRALLRQAAQLRSDPRPRLTGTEFLEIFLAAMVTPPQLFITRIEDCLTRLPSSRPELDGRLRILLSGSVLDNPALLALLEEQALVVADDLCYGSRYYSLDIRVDDHPLPALAEGYLAKVNCPSKFPRDRRWNTILQTARDTDADGIVMIMQKFCDTHRFEQPELEAELKKQGFPVLVLEMERQTVDGGIRTRIQAFLELLEQGRVNKFTGGGREYGCKNR